MIGRNQIFGAHGRQHRQLRIAASTHPPTVFSIPAPNASTSTEFQNPASGSRDRLGSIRSDGVDPFVVVMSVFVFIGVMLFSPPLSVVDPQIRLRLHTESAGPTVSRVGGGAVVLVVMNSNVFEKTPGRERGRVKRRQQFGAVSLTVAMVGSVVICAEAAHAVEPVEASGDRCFAVEGAEGDFALVNVTPVLADGPGDGQLVSSDVVDPPVASNVNFGPGTVDPNLAVAPIGAEGRVCYVNSQHSSVHVVADHLASIDAAVVEPATPSGAPARVLDTRNDDPVQPKSRRCFAVEGAEGDFAFVNVTPVLADGPGDGQVASSDLEHPPLASNVNFGPGTVDPNVAVAPIGADGRVCFFNSHHSTVHVVADHLATFDAGAVSPAIFTGAPRRVLDTREEPAAPTHLVVSLPVGGDGVAYSDWLIDAQVDGPGELAIDDSDIFYLADKLNDRILVIDGDQTSDIELGPLDIRTVTDMYAASDHLVVLEAYVAGPVRYRVHRLSFNGELLETLDFTPQSEYNLDEGLQGLVDTGDDSTIMLRDLSDKHPWPATWNPQTEQLEPASLTVDGYDVERVGTGIQIGNVLIKGEPTLENAWWTRMEYRRHIGTTWYLERWDGTMSVEAWSDDGDFLGAAPIPGNYVDFAGYEIAVGSDGEVYALVTLPDRVEIQRLLPGPDRIITPSPLP